MRVARVGGFFGDEVRWQRLECSQWVRRLCCRPKQGLLGLLVVVGQVLHLKRWDQGDSQSFVTCSIHKDS